MLGMHHQFLLACLCALLSAANVCAQTGDLPERFGRWTAYGPSEKFTADNHYAPLFTEAGLTRSVSRIYSNGSHKSRVSILQLRDPSSAYSILTFFGRVKNSSPVPGKDPSVVGQRLGLDVYTLVAVVDQVGNFVVQVESGKERDFTESDWTTLKDALRKQADKTPLPPIREYLPRQDLDAATQRYALGPAALRAAAESVGKLEIAALADAAGFAQGAEAMLARYRHGRDSGVLLLIDYPTPQLAELHMRHLETAVSEEAKKAGSVIERRGSLLSVVIAPSSPAYAESLRNAVTYETQVTWNEPSATATDPPWAVVLYRIFVGTGVFMIMAVAFGVAFGGFRIFIKRLLPGKVFDRPQQMEVLQLGLTGHKIDTRDLY